MYDGFDMRSDQASRVSRKRALNSQALDNKASDYKALGRQKTLQTAGNHGPFSYFPFTKAVAAETEDLWLRLKSHVTPLEWQVFAPLISEIRKLKREKNAVILAHNYMTPEIFHGVGDYVGDSLGLAKEAARSKAGIIVQAGVYFMAETSKILCPDKKVLIPDKRAGCSLAASITGEDVRGIRQRYPNLPIVTYVNSHAEVKAESDICCTSANAVQIVEAAARLFGTDQVILLPDEYLARNVAKQTDVKILSWTGRCEVHEQFTAKDIEDLRLAYPDVEVLAHPECPTEVVAASDFAGSTAAMNDYVLTRKPKRVALITECSMADNIATGVTDTEFVRPCNLCPHMKRLSLHNIYEALRDEKHEILLDEALMTRARKSVEAMIELSASFLDMRDYDLEKARRHQDVTLL